MVHVIIAIVVTALITCHHHRNHIDLIYSIYPIFVVSVLIVVCMSWWATCDTTYRTTVHGFHTVYTCAFEIAILTVPITKTLACDDGHVYMLAGISAGRPLLHLLISTSTMTTRMLLFNTFNIHYWIFWLPDRLQVDWNVLSCIFFSFSTFAVAASSSRINTNILFVLMCTCCHVSWAICIRLRLSLSGNQQQMSILCVAECRQTRQTLPMPLHSMSTLSIYQWLPINAQMDTWIQCACVCVYEVNTWSMFTSSTRK